MKQVHIWLFIINFFIPLTWSNSQEVKEERNDGEVIDALMKRMEKKPHTIRFGIDLSKPVMAQIDKD